MERELLRASSQKLMSIRFFRYHWLISHSSDILILKNEGGTPALNKTDLAKIRIKVPPLSVQNRLVDVLDNFDAICTDLNIGLPAEIEARKKQYEFYRDQLLTFAAQGETILTDRQTDRQTDEYNALIRLCQPVSICFWVFCCTAFSDYGRLQGRIYYKKGFCPRKHSCHPWRTRACLLY